MEQIEYTIRLPPVSKKNHSQILINRATGRPFLMPSRQYKEYAQNAIWFLQPKPKKPISAPVNVQCIFYTKTRRVVDKSNLEEAAHDVLVCAGILADDCRDVIASTDGSRVYYDKNDPRTEIIITPYEGDYAQWRQWEE